MDPLLPEVHLPVNVGPDLSVPEYAQHIHDNDMVKYEGISQSYNSYLETLPIPPP